ncbi:TetR family transcriptional regulator [Pontibacter ummariensis]|uniref:Transcriptional regulator, TetR family n=1 Tax=Pontibacter ummariensis TaxID=1610492 RepID=A0A239C520_9BACT|nr:TetR/AcrR family transcriptional regulator [Pontibacter ummariensis]PRY15467.1 TetR family transcriptional regulator [Pontibacter ummariensis]SNS14741.1 transcriptional regulator, TetR family [Pontibacter ummariensis]
MEVTVSPRDKIIAAAQALFFSVGYSKVLMADIARQLGMSKKTLYQYFSGKEELLSMVIRAHGQDIQQEVETILANNTLDFPEKARQIFSYVGTKLHDINPSFVKDIKKNAPAAWQELQQYKADAAFLRFNALLEEGARQGYIRKDVPRAMAVLLYASALETILNPSFTQQVPEELMNQLPQTPETVFESLVKIIFTGVMDGKAHT